MMTHAPYWTEPNIKTFELNIQVERLDANRKLKFVDFTQHL